jgi:hypothetical protein
VSEYKFNEVEKLKVDNLLLKKQMLELQMQTIQTSLQSLLESIVTQNDLGTNETVTLLPDYSGFSIKGQDPDIDEACIE